MKYIINLTWSLGDGELSTGKAFAEMNLVKVNLCECFARTRIELIDTLPEVGFGWLSEDIHSTHLRVG